MLELCKPLHPIVFNDLFCLRNQNVHTLSVGIAKKEDFDLHLEAVSLLSESEKFVPKIINRLTRESVNSLGLEWYQNWNRNLPSWEYTPGNINIPILLWLSNLIDSCVNLFIIFGTNFSDSDNRETASKCISKSSSFAMPTLSVWTF